MEASNKLLTTLKAAKAPAVGAWLTLPGAEIARTLASVPGLDWIVIDAEHGALDDAQIHTAIHQIAPKGPSPLVRIPGMDGWIIKRALDAGAHGIVVPLCNTPEQAKAIVSAAKFPPQGVRGFGSSLSMAAFNGIPKIEYLKQANNSLITIVQIETREALENVDAIAAVHGVDVLFVGPTDLSISLGHLPEEGKWHPDVVKGIDTIRDAAKRHGKWASIFTPTGEVAKLRASQGFDMVNTCTDFMVNISSGGS